MVDWKLYFRPFLPGLGLGLVVGVVDVLLVRGPAATGPRLWFVVEIGLAFGMLGVFLSRYAAIRRRVQERVRREMEQG